MKRVVRREKNKTYYRVLHLPIWIWVFFIFPGHITYALYLHGPDSRHWVWLGVVCLFCVWRGWEGRLPGVEPKPYVTHYGLDQPNLPYRVVCYSAAWIAMLVPFTLNLIGLVVAAATGKWTLEQLYGVLYYPLALAVVVGTILNWTPRARRSTQYEGVEKGWFYVSLWTVVSAQVVIWGVWRLAGGYDFSNVELGQIRLVFFLLTSACFFGCGYAGLLPRTKRIYASEELPPLDVA